MSERNSVAIVGGGPAGLAAAEVLARAGAAVTLYDEGSAPGGQLRYRIGGVRSPDGRSVFPPTLASELAERATAAGASVRVRHRVWGIFAGNELAIEADGGAFTVRPERVLLATGSTDRALPFRGGSLPGVFSGRAVQILVNQHLVRPGHRFAIVADEPDASELARTVELAGGEVVGILPVDASELAASGADGVDRLTARGFGEEVDVVVVAAGRMADAGLAFMAEAAAGYSERFGGFVPRVDERYASSVDGLYVAGDCAGPTTPEIALAEGAYAGLAVAASLGLVSDGELAAARAAFVAAHPERAAALAAVSGDFVQVDRVPMGGERA